jgi:hypothetical protein
MFAFVLKDFNLTAVEVSSDRIFYHSFSASYAIGGNGKWETGNGEWRTKVIFLVFRLKQ